MNGTHGLSRRNVLAGIGSLAAGVAGAGYLGAARGQAAMARLPVPARTGPWRLVPSAGAWFGAYPGPGNAHPARYEAMTGRKLDVVMRYEALDGVWPNAADRVLIDEGRWLAVCWSSRLAGSNRPVRWADVAAGRYDAQITAQAHRLAPLGQIWVGYDNEMDGRRRVASSGPLSHYPAAFRRIRNLVSPIAPDVVWVWCPTGANLTQAVADCYPGDDYVDWICYDPYDPKLHKGGPLATYLPFRRWLWRQRLGVGKPLGICETGFHRDQDHNGHAAAWLNAVPDALATLHIKMWLWFNSAGGLGDTSIAPGSAAATALRTIGGHRMLRQPHW